MTLFDTGAVDDYLARIGLDPDDVRAAPRDVETLSRLQTAHVRTVPFENLAIVGNPFGDAAGEGVTLAVDHIYEKVVERRRGGYCFELNGLFVPLLCALGFDAHRAAAIVLNEDGEATTPANHQTVVVSLDRQYVADPGLGNPQMVHPVSLDGEPTPEDAAGVAWRVRETDRPDCGYAMECRTPDHDWKPSYVFDTTPRDLSYFEATSDYFVSAPESVWRNIVIVRKKTEHGYRELRRDTFTRVDPDGHSRREVDRDEWHDVLEREFGLSVRE